MRKLQTLPVAFRVYTFSSPIFSHIVPFSLTGVSISPTVDYLCHSSLSNIPESRTCAFVWLSDAIVTELVLVL